jgi:hypothetical protein
MPWWKKLWPKSASPTPSDLVHQVSLSMPGWEEEAPTGKMRVWRDPHGAVLSLASVESRSWLDEVVESESSVREWARDLATSREAGVIEATAIPYAAGKAMHLIYKRLEMPQYIYTGMLIVPAAEDSLVWTMVAGECGTTGVREAIVTSQLFTTGELKPEDYERTWSKDPYEASFSGVDRSVLRSISDDPSYDSEFPDHPLSRVRRILSELPTCFRLNLPGSSQ